HKILARIVQAALDLAPRVTEAFACDLVERALKIYDAGLADELTSETLLKRAILLQKALFVAGHFDRAEYVHTLAGRFQVMLQSQFQKMLQAPSDSLTVETVDALAKHCLYGLRKLGMRNEIERLLGQMTTSILAGRSLKTVAADLNNWALV